MSRGWLRQLMSLWCLGLVVAAAAVALWRAGAGGQTPPNFEPAAFTPPSPKAERLRDAANGANLVICVMDAARADHVGCYGYPRETTPNIDRLAGESVVFREHIVPYALTKCSTASLFTGQHADTHLAYGNRRLLDGTFTIAEALRGSGFRTVMFSSNPNAAPDTGLGLDFQEVFDQSHVEPLVDSWEELTGPRPLLALIKHWLDRHGERRFFMYVHFDPPHQPYLQPNEMTALFAGRQPPGFAAGDFEFPVGDRKTLAGCLHPPLPEWINIYDANLRFADWAVGELARLLRETGVFGRTVFIVTADHGEAFGEHGYLWHERGVYEELVRVPLLVRFPNGTAAGEIHALTQTVDLLPTVCDLFEITYPRHGLEGRSLLPLLAGEAEHVRRYAYCRSDGKPPSYLVRGEEWALMLWGNGEWRALYDLEADPGQRKNVIQEHLEVAADMTAAFRDFAARQSRPPLEFVEPDAEPIPLPEGTSVKLTPEAKKRLRALGYLK